MSPYKHKKCCGHAVHKNTAFECVVNYYRRGVYKSYYRHIVVSKHVDTVGNIVDTCFQCGNNFFTGCNMLNKISRFNYSMNHFFTALAFVMIQLKFYGEAQPVLYSCTYLHSRNIYAHLSHDEGQ